MLVGHVHRGQLADDGAAHDDFGSLVLLDGSRAFVSARSALVGAEFQAGAVYVFEDTGGDWLQVARLEASDADAFDG
ncbi:hypothetical protein, partial [Klebsiella pneumoniae]|uniref:hypothetical protein n=1 Tax=Klebsiella pneumoniae TaxID=573 RepID=UPI003F90ADE4